MSKKCHNHEDEPAKGCCHSKKCGGKRFVRCLFVTIGLLGAVVAVVYWFGRPGTQEN